MNFTPALHPGSHHSRQILQPAYHYQQARFCTIKIIADSSLANHTNHVKLSPANFTSYPGFLKGFNIPVWQRKYLLLCSFFSIKRERERWRWECHSFRRISHHQSQARNLFSSSFPPLPNQVKSNKKVGIGIRLSLTSLLNMERGNLEILSAQTLLFIPGRETRKGGIVSGKFLTHEMKCKSVELGQES